MVSDRGNKEGTRGHTIYASARKAIVPFQNRGSNDLTL